MPAGRNALFALGGLVGAVFLSGAARLVGQVEVIDAHQDKHCERFNGLEESIEYQERMDLRLIAVQWRMMQILNSKEIVNIADVAWVLDTSPEEVQDIMRMRDSGE